MELQEGTLVFIIVLVMMSFIAISPALTGKIVSQSCCFPPDCEEEYLCEAAKPHLESPGSFKDYRFTGGIILLLAASIFYFSMHKRK